VSERERYGERTPRGPQERRDDDAGAAGYRRARGADEDSLRYGGEPYAYGGQEYGVEGHGGADRRGGWELERGSERTQNFDMDDPGIGQGQAGYAHLPDPRPSRARPDDDFDLEYLRWRDEQLRDHDRDYAEWRRQQHAQYDEQYRQFRQERREHFGRAFHEWRSQRSLGAGAPVPPGAAAIGSGPELGKEPPQDQSAADAEVRNEPGERKNDRSHH
jgi:hypothetical protein